MGWKTRKSLSPLTLLPFRNSTNFAKVNTSQINQNALIARISICKKTSKFPKIDKKKETKNINKNIKVFAKRIETVLYILNKCLKMKVHKILERQTNVHVTATGLEPRTT